MCIYSVYIKGMLMGYSVSVKCVTFSIVGSLQNACNNKMLSELPAIFCKYMYINNEKACGCVVLGWISSPRGKTCTYTLYVHVHWQFMSAVYTVWCLHR